MKNIYSIITAIICLVLQFTSCSHSNKNTFISNPSEYEHLNNVVEAIFFENKKALLDMFSLNAKNSAMTLENDIDRLISYALYESVPDQIELDFVGNQIDKHNEYGRKNIVYHTQYYVRSSSKCFYISLDYCTQDDFDENNEGLIKIIFIEEDPNKEQSKLIETWYRTETPGVYVPET